MYPDLIKSDYLSCNILKLLKKTKVVVTDNSTTFLELISVGFPVLMLMRFNTTIIRESANEHYEELFNAQILFEDPKMLSQHINSIWENLDDWWNKQDVKKARTNFSKNFANYNPNLTSQIYNLIKSV